MAKLKRFPIAGCIALSLLTMTAARSASAFQIEDPDYSSNDFGTTGLLQTPSSRFQEDGTFEAGVSLLNPYRRYYLKWQILPPLEIVFRYTDITNEIFGRRGPGRFIDQSDGEFFSNFFQFKGGGTNLDRGFDLKLKLFSETKLTPSISLGIQDFVGTGLFAGEYIVASKRFNRFDVSLGMGWGFMGTRGQLPNPLRILSSTFDERTRIGGRGGLLEFNRFFSGQNVSIFGGIEYNTPIDGLTIKAELPGSDPDFERGASIIGESFPINFGINYRPANWWDISLGFERGNSIMLRASFKANFNNRGIPKNDPPPPAVNPIDENIASVEANFQEPLSRPSQANLDALYAMIEQRGVRIVSLNTRTLDIQVRLRQLETGQSINETQIAQLIMAFMPGLYKTISMEWIKRDGTMPQASYSRALLDHLPILDTIEGWEEHAPTNITIENNNLVLRFDGENPTFEKIVAALLKPLKSDTVRVETNDESQEYDPDLIEINVEGDQLFDRLNTIDLKPTELYYSGLLFEIRQHDPEERQVNPGEVWLKNVSDITEASVVALDYVRGDEPDELTIEEVASNLFRQMASVGYSGHALHINGPEATVYTYGGVFRQVARNIGRVARAAANTLPSSVNRITVVELVAGLETARVSVLREDIERAAVGRSSAPEILRRAEFRTKGTGINQTKTEADVRRTPDYPLFNYTLGPQLLQHIGDPSEGIIKADVYAELGGVLALSDKIQARGAIRQFIFGNLDEIDRESDSVLPKVRSDIVNYLQQGRTSIARLQVDYITPIAPEVSGRISAGLFEMMYGGVGGEILYKPSDKDWAISADLNWVQQRDFDQLFDFRDYSIVTGHARFYYELPIYNMHFSVSAGRYLAGDYGATFDISREFDSGVRVGAFATFTNVPFDEFGEGSFDKGFYIVIPLDVMLPRRTRRRQAFGFRPLTRDGGQQLNIGPSLYELLRDGNRNNLLRHWDEFLE